MPYSDAFYTRHMAQWCERHAPLSDAIPTPDDARDMMARYLDTLDATERLYAMERGWPNVFAAARESSYLL